MVYDYGRARKTADRLIDKYANESYQARRGASGIAVVNGREVLATPYQFTVVGIKTELDPKLIDGDSVKTGDITGVFKANPPIEVGDVITIDGVEYTVVQPRPVKVSDTSLLFKPIMRAIG